MIRIHKLQNNGVLRAYKVANVRKLPSGLQSVVQDYQYGDKDVIPPSSLLLKSFCTLLSKENIPYQISGNITQVARYKNTYDTLLPQEYLDRLLPHQRLIIQEMTRAERYLCADDVGMGKTISALTALNACALGDSSLNRLCVVTLKNLIPQWHDAVNTWLLPEVYRKIDVLVINYEQLILKRNDWLSQGFLGQAVILDEAHLIKNRSALRSQAAGTLAQAARYCWLLTGTPLERAPDDYWHLLHVLDRKKFSSYWNFREVFTRVETHPYTGYETIVGAKHLEVLHDMVTPHYVRRTREVLGLKEPQVITVPIAISKTHLEEYKALEKDVWDNVRDKPILNAISRMILLRQCAIHSLRRASAALNEGKFPALLDIIEGIDDRKFVVFSSFKWAAEMAAATLAERYGIIYYQAGEDDSGLERFKASNLVQGLVSTTQALGVGHNLQAASVVIHLDLPMSRTQYTQTVGRVSRIGQEHDTLVYHLVMRQTIDEVISRLLRSKEETFNAALVVSNWLEDRREENEFN